MLAGSFLAKQYSHETTTIMHHEELTRHTNCITSLWGTNQLLIEQSTCKTYSRAIRKMVREDTHWSVNTIFSNVVCLFYCCYVRLSTILKYIVHALFYTHGRGQRIQPEYLIIHLYRFYFTFCRAKGFYF